MRPRVLVLLLAGCGLSPQMNTSELPPKVALARSGEYRAWPAEAAPHASTGPHGQVRTFTNPPLFDSLKQGAASHPVGSIVVKELWAQNRITGWAINWKGEDGQWRFFEGFEPTLDQYFYVGTDNGCAGCHQPGLDFVLTKPEALRDAGT